MSWKKIAKYLLFPPMALLVLLFPGAAFALVYGFLRLEETDPVRIGSYVLAFYTLTVWCLRIPEICRNFLRFRRENPLLRRWGEDARLRVRVTLGANALWNTGYGLLQLGLAIHHRSGWFYTLAGYYGCLGLMRLVLLLYTLGHRENPNYQNEWKHYRRCGWTFLALNLVLSVRLFLMLSENRLVRHHEITTIAMATYTFLSLTMATINMVKYRKYNSPVLSASKAISFASALVSLLTLESTMLVTFGETMSPATVNLFMALSGGGVSILILAMAIYMIVLPEKNSNAWRNCNG